MSQGGEIEASLDLPCFAESKKRKKWGKVFVQRCTGLMEVCFHFDAIGQRAYLKEGFSLDTEWHNRGWRPEGFWHHPLHRTASGSRKTRRGCRKQPLAQLEKSWEEAGTSIRVSNQWSELRCSSVWNAGKLCQGRVDSPTWVFSFPTPPGLVKFYI